LHRADKVRSQAHAEAASPPLSSHAQSGKMPLLLSLTRSHRPLPIHPHHRKRERMPAGSQRSRHEGKAKHSRAGSAGFQPAFPFPHVPEAACSGSSFVTGAPSPRVFPIPRDGAPSSPFHSRSATLLWAGRTEIIGEHRFPLAAAPQSEDRAQPFFATDQPIAPPSGPERLRKPTPPTGNTPCGETGGLAVPRTQEKT
jgi:hypothetical protein